MKVRSARSAVLGIAVVVALATGGMAYGSSAADERSRDDQSTATAKVWKAAPPGTERLTGTATMVGKQGVRPSRTISKGSTAEKRPPVTRGPAHTAKARDVDKSDRGKKNAPVTKDGGKKHPRVQPG
ncbi:hypothetical protein F0U44_13655 [Nocardioides humilatus]|uniref:Uncharacterized protein n=1 Tax=Nocardioides humilatus TaxID=2607660 RepID=A0A5B1LI44_9ACTN|nr:hypothetical protein [Nocardioides humilatus]KAA1419470.1 hypothetical protein F0U44_13655 [Nocardioides humilatus]